MKYFLEDFDNLQLIKSGASVVNAVDKAVVEEVEVVVVTLPVVIVVSRTGAEVSARVVMMVVDVAVAVSQALFFNTFSK